MVARITDEEWDKLSPENFETHSLLRAVDAVDELRDDLNDGEYATPPQLRTDLLKLHQLAMAVINEGSRRWYGWTNALSERQRQAFAQRDRAATTRPLYGDVSRAINGRNYRNEMPCGKLTTPTPGRTPTKKSCRRCRNALTKCETSRVDRLTEFSAVPA
jgi:hypothetical protein